MAPTPDDLSPAGSAQYDSDTFTVGDGTWDFTKNTFLLPNLVGTNFETTRYNGMANRFSTLAQYHNIVLAHAVLAVAVFLFLLPTAIFINRFYQGRPGYAVKLHAQINIFAGLLLIAVFILGNFAVGPERSLTNPHHGIGVAIFVLFVLQLVGGRIIKNIRKLRSLRITLHQWSGRALALLGLVQVALGITLYGSPLYCFILYSVWVALLFLLYFIFEYRQPSRREMYGQDGHHGSEHYRATDSEYISGAPTEEKSSKWKWLGPLAAGTGLFALLRGRKKDGQSDYDESSYVTYDQSRGPTVLSSRHHSGTYYSDDKYTDVSAPRNSRGGGGFMKMMGTAAAAVGAAGLASRLMNRAKDREDEYSAVSTETPRRHRVGRETDLTSDWSSEAPTRFRRDDAESSLLPPAAGTAAMAGARSAADSRFGRPVTPTRPSGARHVSRRSFEDSDYSSYVSPSRRALPKEESGGVMKGIFAGLGGGWLGRKMADRRARKEEERLRREDEMRGGSTVSRFTGDGYPSPTRRQSRRGSLHRSSRPAESEFTDFTAMTESSIEPRPRNGYNARPPAHAPAPASEATSVPMGRAGSHSRSRSEIPPATMPPMPADPRGVLSCDGETLDGRPQRRASSRRRSTGAKAQDAAAARAASLAAEEERSYMGSARGSQPAASVRVKMHDDKDRNVTLRRLTDDEAREAAGSRGRAHSETSLSGLDSPSTGRNRYRRDSASTQRRAERAAERRVEAEAEDKDTLAPLSPPHPAFARGRRGKDSAYYSGQPYNQPAGGATATAAAASGPEGSSIAAGQTMSSLGSHGTWSGVSQSNVALDKMSPSAAASAAENRRRRRLERRRGSSAAAASRPSASEMFD